MPNLLTRGLAIVGALQTTGGTILKKVKAGSATFNPGSIAATTKLGTAVTITGAAVGDRVTVNPRTAFEDDIILSEVVVTANTATVFLYNPTAGAIDPASITLDWLWFDLT